MNYANEFKDVPYPSDFAEAEATRLLLADAMDTYSPDLMDRIAARTVGEPALWEDVMINCRGSQQLADLLLDRQLCGLQLEDPKYDRTAIQVQLDAINAQISDIYTEIDSSV